MYVQGVIESNRFDQASKVMISYNIQRMIPLCLYSGSAHASDQFIDNSAKFAEKRVKYYST